MEKQSLRTSAFAAITLATVAITTCLMTFPLMFHYVQRIEANAQAEIDWCYGRSRDMWRDVVSVRMLRPGYSTLIADAKETQHRQRRASAAARFFATQFERIQHDDALLPDYAFESLGVQAAGGGCCTCQRGPPGPPGQAGADGRDGPNGNVGDFGRPGDQVPALVDYRPKFPAQCPCEAEKGPDGQGGPRGNAGRRGSNGPPGNPGVPGDQGDAGDIGQVGRAGQPGAPGQAGGAGGLSSGGQGLAGSPGRAGLKGSRGDAGAPGPNGERGAPGQPGQQGELGAPGQNGALGQSGNQGDLGDPGPVGTCDQCPPARLAPGY